MNLYEIEFSDFGKAYVVSLDWNGAAQAVLAKYPGINIKKIKFLADERKDGPTQLFLPQSK